MGLAAASPCRAQGRVLVRPGATGRAPPAPGPACRYSTKQKAPNRNLLRPQDLLQSLLLGVWDDRGCPTATGLCCHAQLAPKEFRWVLQPSSKDDFTG